MASQNHIIKKQILEVRVSSQKTGKDLEPWIVSTCRGKLNSILQKVCDQLSPEGTLHRIDKLEIDLGGISKANLKDEFIPQLEKELHRVLKETVKTTAVSTVKQQKEVPPPEKRPAGNDLDALRAFLRSGLLPWWVKDTGKTTLDRILQNLLRNSPSELREAIRTALRSPQQTQRLINEFSDEQLYAILEELQQGVSGWFQEVFQDPRGPGWAGLESLAKEYSGHQDRRELWEDILYELTGITAASGHTRPGGIRARMKQKKAGKPNETKHRTEKDFADPSSPSDTTPPKLPFFTNPNDRLQEGTEENPFDTSEENPFDTSEEIYLKNAGLILFWPLLTQFFTQLKLIEDTAFIDPEARHRALIALHYVAFGSEEPAEFQLPLNKLLCGVPLTEPVTTQLILSDSEKEECNALINALLGYNPAWEKMGLASLRQNWLQREGILKYEQNRYSLQVQRELMDVLLDKLPWDIGLVQLPWMTEPISVLW